MFLYICISGLTTFILSYFKIRTFDEKTQNLVEEIKLAIPSSIDPILFIYVMSLLLGFIILPVSIISKVYKAITDEDLFPKD